MNKKYSLTYLIFFINSIVAISQTVLSGNLYNENPYLLNPAYAGYKGNLSVNLNYRQISTDVQGAPNLIGFGINSPVYKNTSLGGRFFKQSEGLLDNISVFVDYSYHLKISNSQSLRFGLATGLNSNQINYSEIVAEDPSSIIDIASRNYEGLFFQSSAGLAYNWQKLDVALLLPTLFESKNRFNPDYSAYISYRIPFTQNPVTIRPSVLLTYNPHKPVLYDLNLTTYWKKQFYVGISYRNRPGLIFSAGFNIKDLSMSYAIEFGLQKQSNIFNQVHELTLSYGFRKKKPLKHDTTAINDIPLIAKTDSVKKDTALVTVNNLNINNDSANLVKNEVDTTIISNKDTTQTNLVYNVPDTSIVELPIDSTMSYVDNAEESELADVDDYEIVSVGNGLYSIKSKNSSTDSLLNSENNKIINDPKVMDELMKKITIKQNEETVNKDINREIIYSIQLFINESNSYILRDGEVAISTWFETDINGKFLYYFGRYNSIEEAKSEALKFDKYSNLKIEIINLNNISKEM